MLGYSLPTMISSHLTRRLSLLAALSLAACGKQELLHDLEERDSNEIIVLLDRNHLSASKIPDEVAGGGGGNKGPRFKIAVSPGDANEAWRILTDNHLPRHKDNGYAEVFATAGLIPTASEEKAKMLQAIEGEIAHTIKSMDGVLDARVHVVIPEESVLKIKEGEKTEPTAAVWFEYKPHAGKAPVTEQQIADLVASSVEGLKPEKVKVIGTQAMPSDVADVEAGGTAGGDLTRIFGLTMLKNDANKFKLGVAGGVLLLALFLVGFIWAMARAAVGGSPPPRSGPPAIG